jgi:hypothetical protein
MKLSEPFKLFKHKHDWKVARTLWPNPVGWGVYCKGCKTLLDSGLKKEEAERRCRELNGEKAKLERMWPEEMWSRQRK